MNNNKHIHNLLNRFKQLSSVEEALYQALGAIIQTYENGGKLLICGNGGSAADSDHMVGELMKGFEKKRPLNKAIKENLSKISAERGNLLAEKLQLGLPAISLASHSALVLAIANDIDYDSIFAQQVIGYGNPGDVLIGFSCSGNSQNVIDAMITAKAKGLTTIAFTGKTGGKAKAFSDILINVPETNISRAQELHVPIYHTLCRIIEEYFFENE